MAPETTGERYVPRLKVRYRDELVAPLKEQLGFTNVMQVPRLEKIVVNMGVGDAIKDGRMLDAALADLTTITGQKPVITKARKSIAGFKLREGMPIGAKVTLRGDRAWEFMDRLVSLALPRIRDFRGLDPAAFDGHGNYTLGVTEQLIFPEVDYDTGGGGARDGHHDRDDRPHRRRRTRAAHRAGLPLRGADGGRGGGLSGRTDTRDRDGWRRRRS